MQGKFDNDQIENFSENINNFLFENFEEQIRFENPLFKFISILLKVKKDIFLFNKNKSKTFKTLPIHLTHSKKILFN